MTLGLPGELREETGNDLFKRNDVRETTSQSELLNEKTSYWSAGGAAWNSRNPDTDQVTRGDNTITAEANGIVFYMPVNLPHGAIVTRVNVTGTSSGETWTFVRALDDGNDVTLASGTINTADTSITNPVIDNDNYTYYIFTSSLDTNDQLWDIRINYITNYD